MKILVVNQFHRRPGGSGPSRINELARSWVALGADVRIIASPLDHATGQTPPRTPPRQKGTEDSVHVSRVRTLAISKRRAFGRIARDMSFAVSAALAREASTWRPDVVMATSPPLFVGIAGARLARRYGVPFVFEVRDLWPDFAVDFGALSGVPAKLAYRLERRIYDRADHIVCVTPAFADRIAAKGIERTKITTIPNGVDEAFLSQGPEPARRQELGWGDKFVAVYAGVHGPAQALDQVLDAASLLKGDPRIRIVLIGEGDQKRRLVQRARTEGLGNVDFLDAVARDEVPKFLGAADAGLATLKDVASFELTYPAKVFEIMGAGKPIVFAGRGACAELIEKAGGGMVVAPERPAELAGALASLAADPARGAAAGARGRAFVSAEYGRDDLAERYLRLLTELARR